MGETDVTKVQVSGEVVDVPIPETREIPLDIDADLVKSLYDNFCEGCVKAGFPAPPRWT